MNAEIVKLTSTHGAGEVVEAPFIHVVFQKGFPADVGVNGCRVEDVLDIAMERLEEFQAGPLACWENEEAIRHLREANRVLMERIRRRQEQGVLNTMSPHQGNRTEDQDDDFSATGS